MPYLTFVTSPDGLAVSVLIGLRRSRVQTLRSAGQPIPAPVLLRAVIDTGADYTSVLDTAVASLGLVPTGRVFVNTASGPAVVNRYAVSLTIPGSSGAQGQDLVRPNLPVLGLAHAPVGFEVLIGLDVLAECLFLHDGRAGQFTIAF